jgi:hypothetical protein
MPILISSQKPADKYYQAAFSFFGGCPSCATLCILQINAFQNQRQLGGFHIDMRSTLLTLRYAKSAALQALCKKAKSTSIPKQNANLVTSFIGKPPTGSRST